MSSASQAHLPYASDPVSNGALRCLQSRPQEEFGSSGPREIWPRPSSVVLSQPCRSTWTGLISLWEYSNRKLPTAGHPSTGTVTPWPRGGHAWIRLRTLIGIPQSASSARQKARLLQGPWIQWPVNGLLLHHLRSGFRPFAYINVVGYDKCYLSSSPLALDLRSSEQQRAWWEKMGLLSLILTHRRCRFRWGLHGTLGTRFHGVSGSCDSVSSVPIAIHGYIYDLTNFEPPAITGVDG